MKRTIPIAVLLGILLFPAVPCMAADNEVTVGVSVWSSTWKESVVTGQGATKKFDNGTELMAGPEVRARFLKNWIAGLSYLRSTGEYGSDSWFTAGDRMKFDRTDLDALAGYLVRDPLNSLDVGFFLAYRSIDAPAAYTNEAAGIRDADIGTWRLTGPGAGILVEKRLDGSTQLLGKLTYLLLEQEFEFASGGAFRFDSSGWALDLAVSHFFTNALSANAGLRFQRTRGEMENGDEVTDAFSGLFGGIAYTF